ncbi:type II secretion system protein GspM [Sphingomonas sp. TX0543]|uniref:type II secretion system protein GspM n=1 Tax=unclassified Sphingomonas TaxID=196159 RepID=UPI0010F58678|nr:type II secretion system protein GspM [Sphingomonas sp. 3P27F8]
MTALRSWFDSRAPRERWLILVMIALFALTIVWAGVIRPVRDGLASAHERYNDAVIRRGETQARANAVHAILRGHPQPLGAPLPDAVRERADAAGFTLGTVDPGGDNVRVVIPSAKAAPLLGWLAGMEGDGVLVDAATITGNGDGTVAAQLTLKARRP